LSANAHALIFDGQVIFIFSEQMAKLQRNIFARETAITLHGIYGDKQRLQNKVEHFHTALRIVCV
jgi:succinylarginine dihydrolase